MAEWDKGGKAGKGGLAATLKTIIFSVHRSRQRYMYDFIVYVCECVWVWVCHRFYFTDYFSPLPFLYPSLSLFLYLSPSLVCVCSLFYTDWCIFRSILMRLEPCGFGFGFGFGFSFGFGIGPLFFGSHCGFLPLAHAKQIEGGLRGVNTGKLSFASGRKSNGTRATLTEPHKPSKQRVKKV